MANNPTKNVKCAKKEEETLQVLCSLWENMREL